MAAIHYAVAIVHRSLRRDAQASVVVCVSFRIVDTLRLWRRSAPIDWRAPLHSTCVSTFDSCRCLLTLKLVAADEASIQIKNQVGGMHAVTLTDVHAANVIYDVAAALKAHSGS